MLLLIRLNVMLLLIINPFECHVVVTLPPITDISMVIQPNNLYIYLGAHLSLTHSGGDDNRW